MRIPASLLFPLLLLSLLFFPSVSEAQQKVNIKFSWTPLPGMIGQRIAVREQADGAWYYPPVVWNALSSSESTFSTVVSNRYWITVHIQSLTSPTTGPTTIVNFLLKHPDVLNQTIREHGVTNFSTEVLGIVPDPDYSPDIISLVDSSAIDGRIIFKTELSKYRPGTADVNLIRPPKNVYEVNDPLKANCKLEYIDIKNDGPKSVSIISGTAVNAQYVSVSPTTSPAQPAVIQPGATQRFQLWFWPLHYNAPYYDFAADLSQPIDQFTPQVIFVTKDVAQVIVPLEGHSTFDADINYDGKVNLGDYGVLKANFLKTPVDPTADINQDGKINLGDLGILRSQYLQERPLP